MCMHNAFALLVCALHFAKTGTWLAFQIVSTLAC